MSEVEGQQFGDDLVHTLNAMFLATEPRVVALVPAAFLEAHLQALILGKLPNLRSKLRGKIFGSEGALTPLSVKIDMAEALGCISQSLAKRAILVARIRNRFAHQIDVRDFDHTEIATLTAQLHEANNSKAPRVFHGGEWKPATKDNNEGRFIAAALSVCCAIAAELYGGDFDIKVESLDKPGTFRTISIRRSPKDQGGPDQAGE